MQDAQHLGCKPDGVVPHELLPGHEQSGPPCYRDDILAATGTAVLLVLNHLIHRHWVVQQAARGIATEAHCLALSRERLRKVGVHRARDHERERLREGVCALRGVDTTSVCMSHGFATRFIACMELALAFQVISPIRRHSVSRRHPS